MISGFVTRPRRRLYSLGLRSEGTVAMSSIQHNARWPSTFQDALNSHLPRRWLRYAETKAVILSRKLLFQPCTAGKGLVWLGSMAVIGTVHHSNSQCNLGFMAFWPSRHVNVYVARNNGWNPSYTYTWGGQT